MATTLVMEAMSQRAGIRVRHREAGFQVKCLQLAGIQDGVAPSDDDHGAGIEPLADAGQGRVVHVGEGPRRPAESEVPSARRRCRAPGRRQVMTRFTSSPSGELVAHRARRQLVEHPDGAAIAAGEGTSARRREHHVVGIGGVREAERTSGLARPRGGPRRGAVARAGVRPEREGDRGPPHAAGLVPGSGRSVLHGRSRCGRSSGSRRPRSRNRTPPGT